MLAESRSTHFGGAQQPVVSGRPEFYTVPGAKPKSRFHVRVRVILAVVAIFGVALLYTATEARITRYGYEINQLKKSIEGVENVNAQYRLEIEQLSSPERLSAYAAQHLSMGQPTDGRVRYVAMNSVGEDAQAVMTSSVPSAQKVEIEVLPEDSHPMVATLSKIFNDYIVLWNNDNKGALTAAAQ